MKTKIILSIAFTIYTLAASAHAMWIETAGKGSKGKAHSFGIYFGEYAENERDSVAKWFSNLKDVQAFVVLPDGSKQKISLTAVTDHYAGSFTPNQDGAYIISLSHTVGEVYGNAKIEYYATATVIVGKASNEYLQSATQLSVRPASEEVKKGKETTLGVFNGGAALSSAKVVVATPEGWVKTTQSGTDGRSYFTPLSEGRYMLEAVRTDKTPGTHNGKTYQSVTHLVTHCIYVR